MVDVGNSEAADARESYLSERRLPSKAGDDDD
jgi:hypothetical protein